MNIPNELLPHGDSFFYAQTEQKSNSQPLYKIPVKRQALEAKNRYIL